MLNAGRNMPVVLISISILFKIITNSEAAPTYLSHFCGSSTYTPHSTYQTNLNNVLSSLSLSSNSTQNVTVFNTSTSGHTPPNIAYGLFLCRGDLNATDCHECVAFAATEVLTRCPNEKSAVIWYDECMLRYNNTSFFSNLSETPEVVMINTLNITFADPYLEMLQIVDGLASIASNDSLNDGFVKGFATQEANFTRLKKIYVLTQCTPDLSSLDCYQCLQTAKNRLAQQRQGSRALYPSCTVRFEIYPFYRQITAAPPLALELASLPTLKFGNNPGRQSTTAASSRSSTYSNFGNNPGYKSFQMDHELIIASSGDRDVREC